VLDEGDKRDMKLLARAILTVGLTVCLHAGPQATAGTDPADACKDAKAKATGKKAADLLKAFGKNLKKADPAKLTSAVSKAQSKLTKAFGNAEAKTGCLTTGDVGMLESKVDAFVTDTIAQFTPVLLYNTEGNRLRRYDVDTIDDPPLAEDILIERASIDQNGRDINGQICRIPDGSGRFVAGEDTGQPTPPAGWGVFEADGTQVGKLTATYFVPGAEPHGCAFNKDGNLFTGEVGEQGFATPSGQLIMWFPPFDDFPGPDGLYPNTNDVSTNFCKIAVDIGTAGAVAIDAQGRVYVAAASQLVVYRFSPPFPTGPDGAGGCGSTDGLGSPMADVVNRETIITPIGISTFAGLAFAPNGNLYASSVLTGQIFEFDTDGNLVRMILDPPDKTLPIPTGAPQDLTVGADGTLYYADLNLVGTLPNVGPGPNGKVWRIRFDTSNDPLAPEMIRENLAFPDGVGLQPGDLEGP
jgi:hypothetical protein